MQKADKSFSIKTALTFSIVCCVLLAAMLVFSCFKLNKNIQQISALSNDIQQNSEKLERTEQLAKSKDALIKRYNALKNKIPAAEEQNEILKQIEAAAGQFKTAEVEIEFKPSKTEGQLTVYPVEVTISNTDYFSLMNIANSITKANRFFRIDEIQIINVSSDTKETAAPKVKCRVVLAAFKK